MYKLIEKYKKQKNIDHNDIIEYINESIINDIDILVIYNYDIFTVEAYATERCKIPYFVINYDKGTKKVEMYYNKLNRKYVEKDNQYGYNY